MTRNEEILANAKAKIEKKQNTITKKQALIEKKQAKANKTTDEYEREDLEFSISCLQGDIETLQKDIKKLEAKLPEYEAKVQAEKDKYSILNDAPQEAIEFMNYLSESSTKNDLAKKYAYKNALKSYWKGEEEIRDRYFKLWCKDEVSRKDEEKQAIKDLKKELKVDELKTTLIDKTDEEITKANAKKAKDIVTNFLEETTYLVGKIIKTDLRVHLGDINGIIEGENGKVKVTTILAGGYNIQCLHTRVLVKKF